MRTKIEETEKVSHFFEGWEETLIWSCLQKVMGAVYADSAEAPTAALAVLGDFCFLAGEPNEELVRCDSLGAHKEFVLLVPQSEAWGKLIEACYGERAKKTVRYALKKEPDVFDREKLWKAVNALPEGYTLRMIDEELFERCRQEQWSADLTGLFPDYETYREGGLGAVVLKGDELVSGASSYSRYLGGIEIEIDTKEEYRRKGLAYSCGAKLILECLERNLYPSWDAQNLWSVALAEKLGYHFSHEYTTYVILNARSDSRS
ncbi:MAG: GNAT family N-acetyltransferase [Eubacteriales bacterium]|nr:GNAT family N-acetyltransferase [Eubacteriales bacterium]